MLSQASVILFTAGGGCISACTGQTYPNMHWVQTPPPWADISQHALGQTPLLRRLLQRTVRILLECTLVEIFHQLNQTLKFFISVNNFSKARWLDHKQYCSQHRVDTIQANGMYSPHCSYNMSFYGIRTLFCVCACASFCCLHTM